MNKQTLINGKNVTIRPTTSVFKKTAYTISQEIYQAFKRIGIEKEYIKLDLCRNPYKRGEPAQIGWTVNENDFYFQCNTQERYVDNLGVLGKVIEQESYAIRNGMKEFGMVMNQFSLDYQEGEKIQSPREILGIDQGNKDLGYISYKYKQLAKETHPDQGGDVDKFKQINEAFNKLKEELK